MLVESSDDYCIVLAAYVWVAGREVERVAAYGVRSSLTLSVIWWYAICYAVLLQLLSYPGTQSDSLDWYGLWTRDPSLSLKLRLDLLSTILRPET